jgi:hypothetical protein
MEVSLKNVGGTRIIKAAILTMNVGDCNGRL